MNKVVLLGVGAVVAATVASGAFGIGIAAASGPNLAGKTYAQASEQLGSAGDKIVISSVVGDQLATADCIVTGSNRAGFLDSSGTAVKKTILVDLNCDGQLAEPGKPGFSAGSTQGRKIAHDYKAMAYYAKNPDQCVGEAATWCKALCDKYADKCPVELQQAVG